MLVSFIDSLKGIVLKEVDGVFVSEIQIFKVGEWTTHPAGDFKITKETFKAMKVNYDEGEREVMIDYQHASFSDNPEESKAAGWVKSLVDKGKDGLFAVVEWTKQAAEYIKNKEFRFISPEFNLNYKNKETGEEQGPTLLAVALTNRPFIDGMDAVTLSEKAKTEYQSMLLDDSLDDKRSLVVNAFHKASFSTIGNDVFVEKVFEDFVIVHRFNDGKLFKVKYRRDTNEIVFGEFIEVETIFKELKKKKETKVKINAEEDNTTKDTNKGTEMNIKEMCERLGLEYNDKVTEKDVYACMDKMKKENEEKDFKASEEKDKVKDMTIRLDEANKKASDAVDRVTTLEKDILTTECDTVISCAVSEGKILPKNKEVWEKRFMKDAEDTKELISTLEPTVSFSEKGSGDDVDDSKEAADLKLDELCLAKSKELGISYGDALKRFA